MRSHMPPKSLDNRLFLANVTMPASRLRALFLAILDPMPGRRECSILLRLPARQCLICAIPGVLNVPPSTKVRSRTRDGKLSRYFETI
jgi:hypothetical protein